MPPSVNVNIKMYRVGELGDCFLLRFSRGDDKTHVLIDCGSFRNGGPSKERMLAIARDIQTQLGEAPLDVVVGTHQHNDHLSGFVHAAEVFRAMPIDTVWLPWLDDPTDLDALQFQQESRQLLALVEQLPAALRAVGAPDDNARTRKMLDNIDEVLQFHGIDPEAMGARGKEPAVPAEGLRFLKSVGQNPPRYLYPGEVVDLPGLPAGAVKVYVLGPPKKTDDLEDIHPRPDETFDHLRLTIDQTRQFLTALPLTAGEQPGDAGPEEHFPFNEKEKFYLDEADYSTLYAEKKTEMLEKVRESNVYRAYHEPDAQWRQINADWLAQAEDFALYLNDLTNNSSLVLAFEIVATKKVLLFVGDAQTGNWRSWSDVRWTDGVPRNKTAQLLRNTVVYKVGHHASHNATYKPAFEKMRHPELVALIPVEKSDPNITKLVNPWRMPARNLYEALKQQTDCRIVRMDDGVPDDCRGKNPALEAGVTVTELYIELEV